MHFLLATDGSHGAMEAARMLAGLPLGPEDRVTILTVLRPEEPGEGETIRASAAEALRGRPVAVETTARRGVPAEEILRAEEALRPDLVVLGSRGLSAAERFWIGSVAERVAQYARGSVLIVWPGHAVLRRVLLGLDASECSAEAAAWLSRFPLPPSCELHAATFITQLQLFARWREARLPLQPLLLRRLERRECARAERRLAALTRGFSAPNRTVRLHVRLGDPAAGLLALAGRLRIDLLVVGSHARGLFSLLLFGSVSDRILEGARCSLLIVRRPSVGGAPPARLSPTSDVV